MNMAMETSRSDIRGLTVPGCFNRFRSRNKDFSHYGAATGPRIDFKIRVPIQVGNLTQTNQ